MPGASAEKSARAGCVVVALRGELDVCTAADGLSALTAPAAAGERVIVDLAELAFMDCYSLGKLMAARAQARRAGGDLVLAAPQPIVLRLLALCGVARHGLVYTSVDEAAAGAAASLAASGIVPSALFRGGAAMRVARMVTGLITAASSPAVKAATGTADPAISHPSAPLTGRADDR